METIKITKKGVAWFNTCHPWIYKDDLVTKTGTGFTAGVSSHETCPRRTIVDVVSESGKFLAKAFYNPHSQIALRIITKKDEDIDRGFWAKRITQAVAYRKGIIKDTNAYRIIFSESDGLPGLVVDCYADVLVIQISSLGMELLKQEITDILLEILKPKAIILRNDISTRKLEDLEQEKSVLVGKQPDLVEVFEGNIKYLVDVWAGHKTGAYLDQRENRFIVANIGVSKIRFPSCTTGQTYRFAPARALDAFCYQGLFSLHLAKIAGEVIALDSSQPGLDIGKKNLELNSIKNVFFVNANVFDALKEFVKTKEKFDIIILDPPPFAKSKKELAQAKRGYKDLNLRAIQCLNEGGHLVTFSCSYNFSEEEFLHSIRLAASDAKKDLYLVAKLMQSKDHPICVTAPESNYLKGFIFNLGT